MGEKEKPKAKSRETLWLQHRMYRGPRQVGVLWQDRLKAQKALEICKCVCHQATGSGKKAIGTVQNMGGPLSVRSGVAVHEDPQCCQLCYKCRDWIFTPMFNEHKKSCDGTPREKPLEDDQLHAIPREILEKLQ